MQALNQGARGNWLGGAVTECDLIVKGVINGKRMGIDRDRDGALDGLDPCPWTANDVGGVAVEDACLKTSLSISVD